LDLIRRKWKKGFRKPEVLFFFQALSGIGYLNGTGMYAPENGCDYRSFQDVMELYKPYEERGYVSTR